MKDTSHIDSLLSRVADGSAGNLFPRLSREAARELIRMVAEWVDEYYVLKDKTGNTKSSNHARKRVRLVLRTRHKIKQSKKGGI